MAALCCNIFGKPVLIQHRVLVLVKFYDNDTNLKPCTWIFLSWKGICPCPSVYCKSRRFERKTERPLGAVHLFINLFINHGIARWLLFAVITVTVKLPVRCEMRFTFIPVKNVTLCVRKVWNWVETLVIHSLSLIVNKAKSDTRPRCICSASHAFYTDIHFKLKSKIKGGLLE